jgi:hypothetical protein
LTLSHFGLATSSLRKGAPITVLFSAFLQAEGDTKTKAEIGKPDPSSVALRRVESRNGTADHGLQDHGTVLEAEEHDKPNAETLKC